MPPIQIIPASETDIDTVCGLYKELFSAMADLQPDSFRHAQQDPAFLRAVITGSRSDLLVARDGKMAVGFALLQEQSTPSYGCLVPHRYAYLMDLAVHTARRGEGIGSALIAASESWARQRGLDYLELNVLEENIRAASLYESYGFSPTMRVMRKKL
ncbi:GNAT family N-acetyltransferase [Anaerotruncus rubiinfantis]|uniref:GNAT family N-acetyltransferase n=1 Tax=Anaerotruncus rubiinfantis TaxID=1720200 RepID=UPI001FAA041C|nr:GNAT family N-acetyltransferase [Anaerotruncus rubiinfantis]